MKWIKSMLTPLLLMVALTLGACTEEGIGAEEVNLISYPESVQSGDISVGYYTELGSFVENYHRSFKAVNDLNNSKDDSEVVVDAIFIEMYKEMLNTFDETLNEFYNEAPPLTKIDKEIHKRAGNVATAHVVHNQMLMEEIEGVNIYSDGEKRASLEFIDSLWKDLTEILNEHEITIERQ